MPVITVMSHDKCVKCGNTRNMNTHHVLYNPEMTVKLCYNCHMQITAANSIVARLLNTKLSNELRLQIWEIFKSLDERGTLYKKKA